MYEFKLKYQPLLSQFLKQLIEIGILYLITGPTLHDKFYSPTVCVSVRLLSGSEKRQTQIHVILLFSNQLEYMSYQ